MGRFVLSLDLLFVLVLVCLVKHCDHFALGRERGLKEISKNLFMLITLLGEDGAGLCAYCAFVC